MANNEDYLNKLIAKAKKSWEGIDVDNYMKNLRDDTFDKGVAENLSKEVASYITEQIKSNMDKVTIKCRDLMVGDWIQSSLNLPEKVIKVEEDSLMTYAQEEFWELNDKNIPPYAIPITEEILKMNGFTWEVWGNNYKNANLLIQEKHMYIEWRWHSSYLAIWFDYNEHNDGVYADIVIPVKYVHELQQALRLAGLRDIADNFAV